MMYGGGGSLLNSTSQIWEIYRISFLSSAVQTDVIKSTKDIHLHFIMVTFQNVKRKQSVCV